MLIVEVALVDPGQAPDCDGTGVLAAKFGRAPSLPRQHNRSKYTTFPIVHCPATSSSVLVDNTTNTYSYELIGVHSI